MMMLLHTTAFKLSMRPTRHGHVDRRDSAVRDGLSQGTAQSIAFTANDKKDVEETTLGASAHQSTLYCGILCRFAVTGNRSIIIRIVNMVTACTLQ
jgi:hypothetical protein